MRRYATAAMIVFGIAAIFAQVVEGALTKQYFFTRRSDVSRCYKEGVIFSSTTALSCSALCLRRAENNCTAFSYFSESRKCILTTSAVSPERCDIAASTTYCLLDSPLCLFSRWPDSAQFLCTVGFDVRTTKSSVGGCAARCMREDGCKAMAYGSTTGECELAMGRVTLRPCNSTEQPPSVYLRENTDPVCPDGWVHNNITGSCVALLTPGSYNYEAAITACEALGPEHERTTRLMQFYTEEEIQWLKNTRAMMNGLWDDIAYISGSRLDSDTLWIWPDGSELPVYDWYEQPQPVESCIALIGAGRAYQWSSVQCFTPFRSAVCEMLPA